MEAVLNREKFQRQCREAKAKQIGLFNKDTGSIELRQQEFRARKLEDGSMFPFGSNRTKGLRMHEVPLAWYRWFLGGAKPEFVAAWPGVADYARAVLASEREQQAQFAPRSQISNRKPETPARPVSDPVKAEAAFAEFQRQKELLK